MTSHFLPEFRGVMGAMNGQLIWNSLERVSRPNVCHLARCNVRVGVGTSVIFYLYQRGRVRLWRVVVTIYQNLATDFLYV